MSVSNIISMLNLTEMPPDKKVNRKLIFLFLNLNLTYHAVGTKNRLGEMFLLSTQNLLLKLMNKEIIAKLHAKPFPNLDLCPYLFWLVGFVALRPKSTAMVIAGRSVHLTTHFPGQA